MSALTAVSRGTSGAAGCPFASAPAGASVVATGASLFVFGFFVELTLEGLVLVSLLFGSRSIQRHPQRVGFIAQAFGNCSFGIEEPVNFFVDKRKPPLDAAALKARCD